MQRTRPALSIMACGLCLLANVASIDTAEALSIRVSQESGFLSNDFDDNILGFINPYVTALSMADFYQYNTPLGASYNGALNGGPTAESGLTQSFFVQGSDGLSFAFFHDRPRDGSGGEAFTLWNLEGDTADVRVRDDRNEFFTTDGTEFFGTHTWFACCTDGGALGSLDGDWTLFGQFLGDPRGVYDWTARSSEGEDIALALEDGRRVRFDIVDVPEASTVAMLGMGLLALSFSRRKLQTD